jgi:methyl-accepting chemotaxis protein
MYSEEGVKSAEITVENLHEISEASQKMAIMISEVNTSSQEQSLGIKQINRLMNGMEDIVQSNAASSEETAGSAEELSAQAVELHLIIDELAELVEGKKPSNSNYSNVSNPPNQMASLPVQNKIEDEVPELIF